MDQISISIFDNKTFFEIIKENKLFSKYLVNHYQDIEICIKESEKENNIVVFFTNAIQQFNKCNFPSILITASSKRSNTHSNNLISFIIWKKVLLLKIDILNLSINNNYEYYNKKSLAII